MNGRWEAWLNRIVSAVNYIMGNVHVRLGDTAGATKLSIRNAADAEVAFIDSAGNISATPIGGGGVTGVVLSNPPITPGTKTKITYDAKGLVTDGADATTADIADSTDKRYVTDAGLTVLGDTSGANTGDVIDATITITDVTTQNASTSKHGWLLKAVAPAAGLLSVVGIAAGETIYALKALFDTTNPAAIGSAAPGTALVAARRDHVHAADHTALGSIGTNTHAQIDTAMTRLANTSGTNTGDQTLPAGANPTATAGKTAVNGSSTSFMRADGAPAIGDSDKVDGYHASVSPSVSTVVVRDASNNILSGNGVFAVGDVYALNGTKGVQAQIQDINVYAASSSLTLTTSYQDVAGVTTGSFTPTVDEYALVWLDVTFNFVGGTASAQVGDNMAARLDVFYSAADHAETITANVLAPGTAAVGTAMLGGNGNAARFYKIALTAGVACTIKVQATNASGARGTAGAATQMMVQRIAR